MCRSLRNHKRQLLHLRCLHPDRLVLRDSACIDLYVLRFPPQSSNDITNGSIVWDVQLKLRIKASVAVVLGFGFVASTATLVRLKYLLAYNDTEDYLLNIANIAIWSITESGLGLIAGSLATLRPLLKYIPFLGTELSGPVSKPTKSQRFTGSHAMQSLSSRKTGTVIEGGGDYDGGWDRLSDQESQKHMIQSQSHEVMPGPRDIKVTTEWSQRPVELEADLRNSDRFDRK
jgi:hypothetical protein